MDGVDTPGSSISSADESQYHQQRLSATRLQLRPGIIPVPVIGTATRRRARARELASVLASLVFGSCLFSVSFRVVSWIVPDVQKNERSTKPHETSEKQSTNQRSQSSKAKNQKPKTAFLNSLSRCITRGPGPLEVVATELPGDIHHFADEKESRHPPCLHRLR